MFQRTQAGNLVEFEQYEKSELQTITAISMSVKMQKDGAIVTKLGSIDFDSCLIDALKNDTLVIFAGAGVSMGSPSNLPSFETLARNIAKGSGRRAKKPYDWFLGQLEHDGIPIHEIASECLSLPVSKHNKLHLDLLRLFREKDHVRLVTTNFDCHFEDAAIELFGGLPDVYCAPALPLGRSFNGIIHVHGSLHRPHEMILSDVDFGRGYLTEGWARRFLLDLFRHYTVLFVGYSHDDVVMKYLARALPADIAANRFALTDKIGIWDSLGIKPILYSLGAGDDRFKELNEGVTQLATCISRGILDWKSRMAEICIAAPPSDQATIDEIIQALNEVHTTRFFVDVARDAEWPKWLDARKYLDALFGFNDLNERDDILSLWLAEQYSIEHPDVMFDLISRHGYKINSVLWRQLGRMLRPDKQKTIDTPTLKRWVSIMLTCLPINIDSNVLIWLAKRCAQQNEVNLTLMVFQTMCRHIFQLEPDTMYFKENKDEFGRHLKAVCPLLADYWQLNEIWTKHLKPHLDQIAQTLMSSIISRFKEINQTLMSWDSSSINRDRIGIFRPAIEENEQNTFTGGIDGDIDVLIDAARDTLEYLSTSSHQLLNAWIVWMIASDIPILRRLAIHGIIINPTMTVDDRLAWLREKFDLYSYPERHETHRAVFLSYPTASETSRKEIVNTILENNPPNSIDWADEMMIDHMHFEWLSWLLLAKPDCSFAMAGLQPIKAKYPEWKPNEHSDFNLGSESAHEVIPRSPWSIEQLLAKMPSEQIDELLTFKDKPMDAPNRYGLLAAIKDACKQEPSWSFELAKILIERAQWSSDLWQSIIESWQVSELSIEQWQSVFSITAMFELHKDHDYPIANLLNSIVSDGGKPLALRILDQANVVALSLWQNLSIDDNDEQSGDWKHRAINNSAGLIVEFWLFGLSLRLNEKTEQDKEIPENYIQWFTMVLEDSTKKGGFGRCLILRQIDFFYTINELWTREHIMPLLKTKNTTVFYQTWEGLLSSRLRHPTLIKELIPVFKYATTRLSIDISDIRRKFVEVYTRLAVYYVDDPTTQFLPALFKYGTLEDRIEFARHIGFILRHMESEPKRQLWNRWLHKYWKKRLQNIPTVLDDDEMRRMLEWLPHLGDLYPEVVLLAVNFSLKRLGQCYMLLELKNSDLVTRYPVETANLLIMLCNCDVSNHVDDFAELNARLPDLSEKLRNQLNEGMARIGVN